MVAELETLGQIESIAEQVEVAELFHAASPSIGCDSA
jgi:hypothetical protein